MKFNFYVLSICLSFALLMISCGGDDNTTFNDVDQINTDLEIQMRVGAETLREGETYTINGTVMQVNTARFYLGNITLTQDTVSIPLDDYYVVSPDNTSFNLGVFEDDSYGFSFGIGIDPVNNDQTTEDFTTRPVSDPLAVQEPSMHWNWNSGYKFLRVDGMVDTNEDGEVDTPVSYHIGGNQYFTTLNSINSVEISAESDEIVMRFDLEQLLAGTEIKLAQSSTGMPVTEIVDPIFNNYGQAFSIRN